MPFLYTQLAKYIPCLSPTPGKSNMAAIWSGFSWQTKSSLYHVYIVQYLWMEVAAGVFLEAHGLCFHNSPELHL